MVDVARERQTQPDIDYHLDYQFSAWEGLAEYVDHWSELDELDREVFQLEWEGITESRLRTLEQWADEGSLAPDQQTRLRELLSLVVKSRPALKKLFTG